MKPALKIVESPEDQLRHLFRRERELAEELARVRSAIVAARSLYMAKHRTWGVRVEWLRRELEG